MNFARAFSVMAGLAIVALLFAVFAFGSALQSADADAVVNAHAGLTLAARRISGAYTTQISTLQSDLTAPLPPGTLDGYARRIVTATIGDNEGIDGGLFLSRQGIVGDGPQPVLNVSERQAIAALAAATLRSEAPRSTIVDLPSGDVVAIDAVALVDHRGVAWARERIPASALRGQRSTLPLIAVAAFGGCFLIAFCGWIVWKMRRDAQLVIDAIASLEADPRARPLFPGGDYGAIGRAVALMAERRAAAEALAQRSERLAAVGRLAANAAHEIRNPLNALHLQLDLLRRRMAPMLDEPATKLQAEISRLDAVVGGMLAIASDPAAPVSAVDLRDVALRAIDVLEADALARDRRFAYACETHMATVQGDAGRLIQLAINVLANAVDAAPAHTEIGVHILPGPTLTVVDHGGGISAGDVSQVFEPFFTTKTRGTGLGLAIAQEIARAHGARIDVTSVPGETAFSIAFGSAS